MSVTFYKFFDSLNLSDKITVNAQVNGHNMQRIFDIVNSLPPLQFSLNKYTNHSIDLQSALQYS